MGMADMWTAWAGIAVKKAHPLASDRLLVSALMSAHAPPPLGLLLFLKEQITRPCDALCSTRRERRFRRTTDAPFCAHRWQALLDMTSRGKHATTALVQSKSAHRTPRASAPAHEARLARGGGMNTRQTRLLHRIDPSEVKL